MHGALSKLAPSIVVSFPMSDYFPRRSACDEETRAFSIDRTASAAPANSGAAYRIGEDQVRGSLQCEMSSVLSAGLGQPRKSPAGLLCQLWPAADIGVLARRTTSIFKIARGLGVRTPIFRPRPIPLAAPEFGEQVDSNSVSKFSECSHRCRWHCQRARVEHARAQPSIRSYQGGGGDMLAPAPYLRGCGP